MEVVIEDKRQYLRMLLKLVPKSMSMNNQKVDDALVRMMMEVFEHGVEFGAKGKVMVNQ